MVRQLEKEYFNNYAWMDRSNVGMGYYVNLPFAFADLDDLCKDIERELDSRSLGAGFTSQGQKIDEFVEHRGYLLRYINDVLYDISDYLEIPLYKGFNEAMDHMAGIDMTDGKTDNTIGLQTNVSVYGGGRGYGFENDMPYLTLEDFIGSRYQETEGSSYESTTYNQKVEGFADLFAEDYENLVKSGKINGKEVTLEKYLDSLVLKEFAYKKDSPFYLELIELLSELTVVIPIYEAAVGKTLITNDYLTDTEGAFKIVSATVNLVTLGQGALISEGGMAFAKMFASEVLAEAVAGSTAILSDKAGAPSSVTIALSLLAGAGAGMAANKALFSGYGSKAVGNVIDKSSKTLTPDDIRYQEYWKQQELLPKSTCSNETLYEYLYKADPNKAAYFAKTGKWPSEIQIPSNSSVSNKDWEIDWSQVPKGGYVLDSNGNPLKHDYWPQNGDVIDRYGPSTGRYTSPVAGKPYNYDNRALPYVEDPATYHQYQVIGNFSNIKSYVNSCGNPELIADIEDYVSIYYGGDYSKLKPQIGEIASGFGTEKGGIQIELPMPVEMLEGLGILSEVK